MPPDGGMSGSAVKTAAWELMTMFRSAAEFKEEKMMTQEMQFKTIVAQYSAVNPEEMTNDMRFREDLGFSSLDFMSFLGELEDTFEVELEEEDALQILTVGEALALLERLQQEA